MILFRIFLKISFLLVFRFLEADSDDDANWLAEECNSMYAKRPRKSQFSNVGQDKVCPSENEGTFAVQIQNSPRSDVITKTWNLIVLFFQG